ncbi:TPA: hypothetical protein ACH3X3_007970 [Trebouxia sp. C0006]
MSAGKKKGAPETAFGPTKSSGASKFSKSSPGPPEARQKSRGVGRGGQHADQQRLRLCALWCARLKSQHARLCLLADVRSNSCQGTGQSMQPRSRHGYFLPVLWPSGSAWSWLPKGTRASTSLSYDVERTSKGQGAKARGTGSRRIPQRLSAEERRQYNIAKQKV